MKINKHIIRKVLVTTGWVALGVGAMVLHISAAKKKDAREISGLRINIVGVNNNYFIDKKDVREIIEREAGQKIEGLEVEALNLRKIEGEIRKDIWIRNAELFIDNNGVLQVDIDEREPIARIFTLEGSTFYIDSSLMRLPLSEKFSARLPAFTGFPSEAVVLSKKDSALLNDIRELSTTIQNDNFLMGMIDQVDIVDGESFEMIPKIGNQVIVFGDGEDSEDKFKRLRLFYKQVMVKAGWNYYSHVNLRYKGQVVAKRRGAEDIVADSLRTLQLMKMIAENAERMSEDSMLTVMKDGDKNTSDSTIVQHSLQRDDEEQDERVSLPVSEPDKPVALDIPKPSATSPTVVKAPVPTKQVKQPVKNAAKSSQDKPVKKPAVKQTETKPAPAQKPKAVMQPVIKKQNEY